MKTKINMFAAGMVILKLISVGTVFGQESDPVLAEVRYDFTHVSDTNNRDEPREEEMVLYIGAKSSLYKSYTLASKIEEMTKQLKEEGHQPAGSRQIFAFSSPDISNEEVFHFPQKKHLVISDKVGMTNYLLPQDYPQIDWQIGNETKEIGGYSCQQASAVFGGREYTAWFTTELPFPYGPWKLHGLPGLILHAEDSKQEVIFRYAGFDKKEEGLLAIALPENASETNAKALARAKTAFEANPAENLIKSMGLPAGAQMQTEVIYKDDSGRELSKEEAEAMQAMGNKERKKSFNNPIER